MLVAALLCMFVVVLALVVAQRRRGDRAMLRLYQQLAARDAFQRSMLANAGLAIIATDRDGTITLINPAAEALVGYTAEEVVGEADLGLFHDPAEVMACMSDGVVRPVDVIIADADVAGTREWTYVRSDGGRVPVEVTVSALHHDDGGLYGYLAVAVDLTLRKQQELELVDLNRLLEERTLQAESASEAKSMFLANTSHEIRTPMNAIMGASYLLQQTQLSREQRESIATLQSATKTLLGMINDVLDLSKIEARQLVLENVPFDLRQVIQDVRSMMTGLAAEKQLAVEVAVDPAVPATVAGDAVRLTQILTNLAGNAIKFTDRGRVTLAIDVTDGGLADDDIVWLRMRVADTGHGIAPDVLPQLFTPFTQGSVTGARRAAGTGLGLAIVRRLATLMGGTVDATSTLGVGSEFTCVVPFGRAATSVETALASPSVRTEGSRRLAGAHVLVVDDSPLNQVVARRILELEGASVEVASDGREAIACVTARRFDAVLMDIQMPNLDGISATREIRKLAGGAELPIIALTAGAMSHEREAAREAGVDEVVPKPFEPAVVIASVRRRIARMDVSQRIAVIRSTAVFPPVDGIDAEDAQHRLLGDVTLFRTLAQTFAVDVDRMLAELPPLIAADDRAALRTALHRLRGGAGSIGARDLFTVATEAEHALHASDANALLERVLAELGRLSRSLAAVAGVERAAAHGTDLAPLLGALRAHDLRAIELFAAVSPSVIADHDRVRGLIDGLDFAAALALLERAPATSC